MLHVKQFIMSITKNNELPSLDFIAGLIVGEGSFLWTKQQNTKIPVFQLKMPANEKPLFDLIRNKLCLKETVHEYNHKNRHYVLLLIRKRTTIENILIPALEGRLFGQKKEKFDKWKDDYFNNKLNFIYKHYQ